MLDERRRRPNATIYEHRLTTEYPREESPFFFLGRDLNMGEMENKIKQIGDFRSTNI